MRAHVAPMPQGGSPSPVRCATHPAPPTLHRLPCTSKIQSPVARATESAAGRPRAGSSARKLPFSAAQASPPTRRRTLRLVIHPQKNHPHVPSCKPAPLSQVQVREFTLRPITTAQIVAALLIISSSASDTEGVKSDSNSGNKKQC